MCVHRFMHECCCYRAATAHIYMLIFKHYNFTSVSWITKKVSTSAFLSLTLQSPTISVLKLTFSDVTQTSALLPSHI